MRAAQGREGEWKVQGRGDEGQIRPVGAFTLRAGSTESCAEWGPLVAIGRVQ